MGTRHKHISQTLNGKINTHKKADVSRLFYRFYRKLAFDNSVQLRIGKPHWPQMFLVDLDKH